MEPKELLSACRPAFQELLRRFGNRGASIGIMKNGKADYLGISIDTVETAAPDEDTVHLISSMTKPILAVGIGILVASRKIKLETLVKDILPLQNAVCRHRNGAPLRVCDLLDHRSEFFRCDRLWESRDGGIGIRGDDSILQLYECLPLNEEYNNESKYHNSRNYINLSYSLLAMVIERVTGVGWTEFLHTEVFDPLGMARSTADMSSRKPVGNIAESYCARIDGDGFRGLAENYRDPVAIHEKLLQRITNEDQVATAQPVTLSKCSDTPTYIGAAAGIRSSVSDLLKFYKCCVELFTDTDKPPSIDRQNGNLARLKAGIVAIQNHLRDMVRDEKCAYAGGWNPVYLPWDRKQRAPGADGENYTRLSAIAQLGIPGFQDEKDYWPFFHQEVSDKPDRQLAWFHGGNMVGATSFVFIIPGLHLAVVVLCCTRGFYVDAPNLLGLTLADCLYQKRSKPEVKTCLQKVSRLGDHLAARYMAEVGKYELILMSDYEQEFAKVGKYRGCVGKYALTEGIFLEILPNEAENYLELRPPGEQYRYPLRAKRNGNLAGKITMSFAMKMETAHATGLGGKHWLNPKASEVTFSRQQGGDNGFDQLVWTFEGKNTRPFFKKEDVE